MKNRIFAAKKSNIIATLNHQKGNKKDLTEKVFINHGAAAIPIHLQTPYNYYEQLLCDIITPVDNVLDLCCGDGIHTIILGKLSKSVTAVDIDENSIELAKKRANQTNIKNIDFLVLDVEYLNLGKQVYDVVTCAGSLSYLDLDNFFKVINYHLKPNGKIVIVDSFNENIIYRLNRYIHYLKGQRSYSTLKRMPNKKTIYKFQKEFQNVEVSYFGTFSFLTPILGIFYTPSNIKKIIDNLDVKFRLFRKLAFKIVLLAQKRK